MCKVKIDLNSKSFCYYLGFLWADGYISKDKHYKIYLTLKEEDGRAIEKYIKSVGDIKMKYKKSTGQISHYIGDKELHSFLKSNGYYTKSTDSPSTLLNIIPDNMKPYFFLGLIDGDGGFYFYKKGYLRNFTVTSSEHQDWSHMIKLSEYLDINKYDIIKRNTGKGMNSVYRINNKKDIEKIHNYIYSDINFIPLTRKYLISTEIIK
jgi:hypothetical protein